MSDLISNNGAIGGPAITTILAFLHFVLYPSVTVKSYTSRLTAGIKACTTSNLQAATTSAAYATLQGTYKATRILLPPIDELAAVR